MIQRRPWGRSASFESHAARYPRQHPPSRDRIHSAALPPRQRRTPTPAPSVNLPLNGPSTASSAWTSPKGPECVRLLSPSRGPLLPRSKRVNRRFLRGDTIADFRGKPSLSGTRAISASVPANGSEGPASSSPLKIGSAPRHPGRGGGPLPFLRRIASPGMKKRAGGSPLQRRALRSMSRLAIRRCGHTEVQEKGQRG